MGIDHAALHDPKNFKYAILIIVIAAAVLSPDGGGVGMLAMGGR